MPTSASIPIFIPEVEAFGGAERSVLALSAWLHTQGHANHILCYEDRVGLERYASHPLQVVQLKPAPGVRWKLKSLRAAALNDGPRVIASGYQPALHLTLAGVRGFHCLMHDTASLFGDAAHRSIASKARIAVSNKMIGFGLRSGGRTAVNSERLKQECFDDFGVWADIVRMGGHRAGADSSPHPVSGTLRMLSVARVEPNKRIDWILRSLIQLEATGLSSRIDWHLDVVGKGSQIDKLREIAEAGGLKERVVFHGFVEDDAVELLYRQAHLFLMPAVQGYGIPALESLYRGVPVLLHRDSGVSDILLDTPWATVFTGGEDALVEALVGAIDRAIQCGHCATPQPVLPTEESWAAEIQNLFGYR